MNRTISKYGYHNLADKPAPKTMSTSNVEIQVKKDATSTPHTAWDATLFGSAIKQISIMIETDSPKKETGDKPPFKN